jgi:hypothetical protein
MPRQPRKPSTFARLWLLTSLGAFLLLAGLLGWWQRQLPGRLREAAGNGRLEACVRLGRQLGALQTLQPAQQALVEGCLRRQAQQRWDQGQWWAALDLQRRLIARSADPVAEGQQLQRWRQDLRRRVLVLYRRQGLRPAQELLQASGESRFPDGQELRNSLREHWAANRYGLAAARSAADEGRWWEALNKLNHLDHPWWQRQAVPLRQRVLAAIDDLRRHHENEDSHGGAHAGGSTGGEAVDQQQLDGRIRLLVGQGLSDWAAFERACGDLGGRIVEDGPESACQRLRP